MSGSWGGSRSIMSANQQLRTNSFGDDTRPSLGPKAIFSFVELEQFEHFIAGVISVNLLVLAGETDYYQDWEGWHVIDNTFLAIFSAELVSKVCYWGYHHFFCGPDKYWHWLDTMVVSLGVFEDINLFVLKNDRLKPFVRVSKLARLLRLVRFFKVVPQLSALAHAFRTMLESFAVVFGVMFSFLLVCGIFCTRMLGRGEGFDLEDELVKSKFGEIEANFRDLPTSMFALFQVTTMDNWIDIAAPVLDLDVRWQGFFVVFISFASWTMISILTAVASENVVEAALGREEAARKEQEDLRKAFLEFLRQAFVEADADGNGLMDKDEFTTLIHKEEVVERMKNGSSLTPENLMTVWDDLDSSRTGELTIDEFVSGFAMMGEQFSTKHLANFDYSLQRASAATMARIGHLHENLISVQRRNQRLLLELREQGQRRRDVANQLWHWRTWAMQQKSTDPGLLKELEALEKPTCL